MVAIYAAGSLAVKQRQWPKARQALTEAPRRRAYGCDHFQPSLTQLLHRLLALKSPLQGASHALF
jgi:hypothetical protein